MKELVNQLNHYRERAGLSQGELADKAHINRSSISLYEAGKRQMSTNTALEIAEALNAPVAAVQGTIGDPDALKGKVMASIRDLQVGNVTLGEASGHILTEVDKFVTPRLNEKANVE